MLKNQCQAVKPVEREPYTGEVVAVANSGKRDAAASDLDTPTRPCTRHGGLRDLHESSFSLSGNNQHIHFLFGPCLMTQGAEEGGFHRKLEHVGLNLDEFVFAFLTFIALISLMTVEHDLRNSCKPRTYQVNFCF